MIVIPLAFLTVCAFLLWFIIGARGHWVLKGLAVISTAFFSVFLWQSLGNIQGYPTNQELPEEFEIKWIVVAEPNQKTEDEGAIYIWLKDSKEISKEFENVPRVHKTGYSRERHQQAAKIQAKIGKGGKYYGKKGKGTGGEGEGQGLPGGNEGKNKEGKGMGSLSQEQDYVFHELPPPSFPEKNLTPP